MVADAGLALGFEAGAQGPQSWTDFTTPEPAAQKTVKIASSGHGWGFGGGLSTIAGLWKLRSTG